jgi:hypothetical protein
MTSPKVKRFDRSDVMALLALLISLGAFAVSVLEANIMRDQQRIMQIQQKASVYPYLSKNIKLGSENGADFTLSIVNKGVGPGKIKNVKFRFDDQTFETTEEVRAEIMKKLEGKIRTIAISELNTYFISSGEEKNIISILLKEGTSILELLTSISLDVDVEYCSIYEECWQTNDEGSDPLKMTE